MTDIWADSFARSLRCHWSEAIGSWLEGWGGGREGAKERVSNVWRPRFNCQRKTVAASTPHLEPPHPGGGFGFLLHSSQISLDAARSVFLTFSILICTKGTAQGLGEAEWKLIQFGEVSKLGNNWNREVPLLDWPPGNAFAQFDELNFRLDVYFIGIGKQGTIYEEQFITAGIMWKSDRNCKL